MPYIIDTDERLHDLCEAGVRLLDRGGIEAVTLRAIGRESGITPGSLLHYLESRDRILAVLASQIRRRLTDMSLFSLTVEDRSEPMLTLFPGDEDEAALVRAYLALRVKAQTHGGVAVGLELGDLAEARVLMLQLGISFQQSPVAFAVLMGLREATSRREAPIARTDAVAALDALRPTPQR